MMPLMIFGRAGFSYLAPTELKMASLGPPRVGALGICARMRQSLNPRKRIGEDGTPSPFNK